MILTIEELCKELKISRTTFYKYVRSRIQDKEMRFSKRTIRYPANVLELLQGGNL